MWLHPWYSLVWPETMCRGQTRAPKARGSRRSRCVGWSLGRGVPLQPTRGLGSIVSSPNMVRGEDLVANGFSAYSRPQNASRKEKRDCDVIWTIDTTIFLSLSGPRGATAATVPCPCVVQNKNSNTTPNCATLKLIVYAYCFYHTLATTLIPFVPRARHSKSGGTCPCAPLFRRLWLVVLDRLSLVIRRRWLLPWQRQTAKML